jgi:hypothetical protein
MDVEPSAANARVVADPTTIKPMASVSATA